MREVLEERERRRRRRSAVLSPASPAPSRRPVKSTPTLLRRRMSRLTRTTEKFVDRAATAGSSPVWMFSSAEAVAADAAGQAAADIDRNRTPALEADAPAVEEDRRIAAGVLAGRLHAAERERALVLQEELALLREEQAEARQVDLLLIGLDLREVGVDREIGGEVLRDAVFHVDADVGRDVVSRRRMCVAPRCSRWRSRTA